MVAETKDWKAHIRKDSMSHIVDMITVILNENCWPEDIGKYTFCKEKN